MKLDDWRWSMEYDRVQQRVVHRELLFPFILIWNIACRMNNRFSFLILSILYWPLLYSSFLKSAVNFLLNVMFNIGCNLDNNIFTRGTEGAITPAAGCYRRELVPMVTYADLFEFVIMLCAVITLVILLIKHKNSAPQSGKLRCYFLERMLYRRLGVFQLSVLLLSILQLIPCYLSNHSLQLQLSTSTVGQPKMTVVSIKKKGIYVVIQKIQKRRPRFMQ